MHIKRKPTFDKLNKFENNRLSRFLRKLQNIKSRQNTNI